MIVIYFYAQARLVDDDADSCGLAVVLYNTWNWQNAGNNTEQTMVISSKRQKIAPQQLEGNTYVTKM